MAVIKIDDELYEKIKKLIKEGDNRFDYPTVKAFVDKAVFAALKNNPEEHQAAEQQQATGQKQPAGQRPQSRQKNAKGGDR
ncbi:MAG TPA: hypothetical protein VJI75_06390 [Candidatus Nanoarchaeia archaeon]|nr:hypothetical protein [Candidatus Nanoarchaeia archaeon]